MSKTLFVFAQVNPLDAIALDSIASAQLVGDKIIFNVVDEHGQKSELRKPRTAYILNQIEQYAIELSGE